MLRSRGRSVVSQTERCGGGFQEHARSLPHGPIFRNIKIAVFLLVGFGMLSPFIPALVPGARAQSATFVYDNASRLVAVDNGSGIIAQYQYDPVGNLLSITRLNGTQLAIFTVSPNNGPVGTQITIYGDGFSTNPASETLTFPSGPEGRAGSQVNATIVSSTQTTIVAIVPTGCASGGTLTTPAGEASFAFAVTSSGTQPE